MVCCLSGDCYHNIIIESDDIAGIFSVFMGCWLCSGNSVVQLSGPTNQHFDLTARYKITHHACFAV